jgi:hypothetical protein
MPRHYTVEQIETYEVEANSSEEAIEIVNNWDNSFASKVERRVVFVGQALPEIVR